MPSASAGRDDQQGSVIASFLRDQLKLDKIAILDDKTTYGEGIAKIVKAAIESKGGQVVMFQGVDANDFDFRANIAVAQGAGAQAVMWGGMYKGGGPLCVQMREAGFNVPFVSDDGCMDQKFVEAVGANAKDAYVSFGKDYTTTPAAQAFIAATSKSTIRTSAHTPSRLRRGGGAFHRDAEGGHNRCRQGRGGDEEPAVRHDPGPDRIRQQGRPEGGRLCHLDGEGRQTAGVGAVAVSSTLTDILIGGISRGAMYALVALGYTMVYGVLGMINFAHGEIFMIGMFACVYAIGVFSVAWGNQVVINLVLASSSRWFSPPPTATRTSASPTAACARPTCSRR